MASQCKVQDIKRKFESLIVENKPAIVNQNEQLCKQSYSESFAANCLVANSNLESESDEESTKTTLSRQPSDPSKKLHRSHAFRCDRTQKIRHSDSNNSETDFLARMCEKKLSKDRLKRLGNVLEDRMRRESFKPDLIPQNNVVSGFRESIHNSVPDDKVPKHILDQYAKVNKRNEPKKDSTVDSGVGSETENLDDEKYGQIRKPNLILKESNSDDTIRLEKKNPHVVLTDTLKKALKQPLPVGPPPEKPPRTFTSSPAQEKKSTKHMLDRLEEELLKREAKEKEKRPKELHYMCTEILDIHQRSLPNPKPVNCAMKYNTSTLPGHLNGVRISTKKTDTEHTYDIPFDESTEKENERIDVPTNFEKIRSNFENGFQKSNKTVGNSNGGRTADSKFKHVNIEVGGESPRQLRQCDFKNGRKFGTEAKRYRRNERNDRLLSLPKKCNKMDAERETLYRLMDEIYATVKVGNTMDDDRLGSSTDGSTTDESVKITRSLTEKRKNYVRGISCRIAYLDPKNIKNFRSKTITCTYKDIDNPYSTHRSWKSFRTSQKDLSQRTPADDSRDSRELSTDELNREEAGIDEKTGCLDIELCFEPREKGLFNVCMLVGFNFMNSQAYVKSVFPEQVIPPPHIESLIFPETLSSEDRDDWTPDGVSAQCYSLVLTDEKGERSYGYCRRVLPEGASACLPLAYCLIGKYRAPGFYYKVLQEIESLHGNPDLEMDSVLQQLFETDFPEPGEEIVLKYNRDQTVNQMKDQSMRMADMKRSKTMLELRRRKRDNSPGDVILGRDEAVRGREYSEMPTKRRILTKRETNSLLPDYYDLENNNRPVDSSVIKHIKRPLEPRVDENNLSALLDSLGAGLSIKVFASLLLERKVFIIGDKLSEVSSCIEALQSVLYPFVWQQPLISSVPAAIQQDMLDAPLPILAGVLRRGTHADLDLAGVQFEGMLIDLSKTSKVLFCEGDESTILPTHSYKSLKTSLQMWSNKHRDKHEDKQSRNLLISEAFLRFFVEILGDFSKCFSVGELKEGGFGKAGTVFDKETFIKSALTKQNQHFLEWFTETAMFNHFIQNMAVLHSAIGQSEASTQSKVAAAGQSQRSDLVDTPLPNFYQVFNDRLKTANRTNVQTKKSLVFLKNKMKDMLVKFQK